MMRFQLFVKGKNVWDFHNPAIFPVLQTNNDIMSHGFLIRIKNWLSL
jgi:hypothetical protein